MKKSVLALWIAISLTGLSLAGVWGFAWYYYIVQGNLRTGDGSSGNGRGGSGAGGSNGSGSESALLGEMSGTVKDEDTGEPIEGASVQWQLEGTASSVFTDDNGCFSAAVTTWELLSSHSASVTVKWEPFSLTSTPPSGGFPVPIWISGRRLPGSIFDVTLMLMLLMGLDAANSSNGAHSRKIPAKTKTAQRFILWNINFPPDFRQGF